MQALIAHTHVTKDSEHETDVTDFLAKVYPSDEQDPVVDAVDKKGSTALLLAAREGHTGVVNVLGDIACSQHTKEGNGAGWSRSALLSLADENGRTPLQEAVAAGHGKTVEALLAYLDTETGKRQNWREKVLAWKDKKGMTALQLAEEKGHKAIVELLKKAAEKK